MALQRYGLGWIRAIFRGRHQRYCLVIMAALTIINALIVFLFALNGTDSSSSVATFVFPPLSNIAPGCGSKSVAFPDPDVEIDANTANVLNPNPNYQLVPLSEWDHADGPAFYVRMQDVFVTGDSLKAFNCHVVYFGGGCALFPDPYPIDDLRQTRQHQAQYLDKAVLISQRYGYAYYHWMIEALPRLIMLYDIIQAHPSMKLVMFETEIAEVGPTVLRILDIDPERVVWYNAEAAYFIHDVIIPSPALCGVPITTALRALKSLLRIKLIDKYPKKFRASSAQYTIVIQDRGQSRRSLLNHKDLVEAVTTTNPDARVITFGPNEDFLSMAQKHFSADLIIGPHGAGLSNVLLAPDGASVIEIHPDSGNQYDEGPHYVNSCHQRTALRTGLRSFLLLEDNGDVANPFRSNITRVVDTVRKIRAGDFDHIDHYVSWQLKEA